VKPDRLVELLSASPVYRPLDALLEKLHG